MDKTTRNHIQRATQASRKLLQEAFRDQLEGTYDILLDGTIVEQLGSHLSDRQMVIRSKLVAAVAHKRSTGLKAKEAVDAYLREAAFTALNRFVALKMLEARQLVQECVSKGEDSSGFNEFTALAPGLVALEDKGYRLYIETLFDEIGQEVKVLFDRRDVASLLWPDRQTLLELLGILNAPELASVWAEDETIGWVYQYFNGDEERTQMRKESQAPRNSRELAVRNQFFTPRYVVQFLTDNTLGRTWYEMMQGDTQLADLDYLVRRSNEVFLAEAELATETDPGDSELSQEELLQQTVHVPFRNKKDPRDLRILDPACGSGHFLLYTFDLLITIYEEAWDDAGAAVFTQTGTQLRAHYESLEDLRRAMPELILRHNLHGVDIDPRAAQIAALALWMRAQRAYNQFEVDRAQRPPITKTNIVVAEPMPGDAELVDEFATSLKPAVLGDLFKKMVEEMKLAGELGSLLKIEESIAKAVKEASEASQQGDLFAGKVESPDFWDTADEKIIAALGSFAESAAGAGGVRRQLFAGDAAQGVAFIKLMRKRFDAVLMNPPFGAASQKSKGLFEANYPFTKNDIYGAFVERALMTLSAGGARIGAITSRTGFFISSFQKWREKVLLPSTELEALADLGGGVLDAAMVETAAYTMSHNLSSQQKPKHSIFFRLASFEDKHQGLLQHTKLVSERTGHSTYLRRLSSFSFLPQTPICYWIPNNVLEILRGSDALEPRWATVVVGVQTDDDPRFVRHWTEAPEECIGTSLESTLEEEGWITFLKGDSSAPFYHDHELLLNWKNNGDELRAATQDAPGGRVNNEDHYYHSGISWALRTDFFAPHIVPPGCIPSVSRYEAIPSLNNGVDPLALLALMSAPIYDFIAKLQMEAWKQPKFIPGVIRKLPLPNLEENEVARLRDLAQEAVIASLQLAKTKESCRLFEVPWPYAEPPMSLAVGVAEYKAFVSRNLSQLELIHQRIGITVDEVFGVADSQRNWYSYFETEQIVTQEPIGPIMQMRRMWLRQTEDFVPAVVSWLVGCAFGRWRSKQGTTTNPPGQQINPLNLLEQVTRSQAACDSHLSFTDICVAVDDPGQEGDLVNVLEEIIAQVWERSDDSVSEEFAKLLPAPSLRTYIQNPSRFFKWHVSQYTRSRRKAPIYWQLATPSASYSVWCYYHRLTRDTFFRVANDYVTPKVDHEERKLNTLRQEAGPDPSSKHRKEIDAQETFVAELRAFLTEVTRIAPLWNPNLNDGVIINFAPLWRLVPQHKTWQKECKKVWDKLVKGDYDWAHLAMHLWPDRVVPKCQTDRSLAIAHGLEDAFWYEDDEGDKTVWKERQVSQDRVAELVVERSSTAVKAALEDLLYAPTPSGSKRRARGGSAA